MRELPLSQLIHENMAIVMTFTFSQGSITKLIDEKFLGECKYLLKFSSDIPARNAIRACLELAVLIRLLDEDEKISHYQKQIAPDRSFGIIHRPDGTNSILSLREMANKIIHAARLEWNLSDQDNPKLVCHAPPEQESSKHQWKRAEVDIVALAAFCGLLMS